MRLQIVTIMFLLATIAGCSSAPVGEEVASSDQPLTGSRHLESSTLELRAGLTRAEFTFADGPDHFAVTRVDKPLSLRKGSVLLLPARNGNGKGYEWTDDGVSYAESPAGILAKDGFEVWLFSPRTTFLAPGSCDAPGSCASANAWGMDTYLDDIEFLRRRIALLHPLSRPFIGGMSLGTILADASVNAHPTAYAGLISLEGLIKSNDAAFRTGFAPICAGESAAVAGGATVEGNFGGTLNPAYTFAATNPTGLTPFPNFPPGFTNEQAFVGILAFPNPGVPIPVRGFVIQAGNPFVPALTYTTISRVGKMVTTGNWYESVHLERDFDCSFAGVETKYSNNLAAFKGPIIAFEAGLGFGAYMNDTIAATGSTDVTVLPAPTYGHGDHLVGTAYKTSLMAPLLTWLNAHN